MTHLELWQSETYVSASEAAWLDWAKQVEAKLGHSLDGDQAEDGYSIDYAYDAFADGVSVDDYCAEVSDAAR